MIMVAVVLISTSMLEQPWLSTFSCSFNWRSYFWYLWNGTINAQLFILLSCFKNITLKIKVRLHFYSICKGTISRYTFCWNMLNVDFFSRLTHSQCNRMLKFRYMKDYLLDTIMNWSGPLILLDFQTNKI